MEKVNDKAIEEKQKVYNAALEAFHSMLLDEDGFFDMTRVNVALAAAIEAATPYILASQWQDISTAPKDGRQIIVNAPQLESGSTYAYWEKGAWHLAYDGKPFGLHVEPPTDWMPLPNPPQTPSAETKGE